MKKTILLLVLSSLSMHMPLWAMEQTKEPDKPKSCGAKGAIWLVNQVEKPLYACFLPEKRKFAPFSSDSYGVLKPLFEKKHVTIQNVRLTELEEDVHLKDVATKARLGGLCLFLGRKKYSSNIHYDAYTADSIAQFIDGAIQHAIAIPEQLYTQDNELIGMSIHGMIEREIARISWAYTSCDMEVRQFWRNCGWAGYSLAALVMAYFEPYSAIATGPGGLLLESIVRESAEIASEGALDARAAQLAETTDHLVATLTASTHAPNAEKEMQHAENRYKDEQYPVSLSLRAQRILNLLKIQDQLKKDE